MFWPQVLRGIAIMFCLLPPTRLALGALTAAQVPDASGLFNLMRNLGGAIGIALIDTILYGRTGGHAEALRDRLIAGDVTAAQAIGLDLQSVHPPAAGRVGRHRRSLCPPDGRTRGVRAQRQRGLGAARRVALVGLLLIPFAGAQPQAQRRRSEKTLTGAPGEERFVLHAERVSRLRGYLGRAILASPA